VASLQKQFGKESFQIIGVHSPEFDHERDPANVRDHVNSLGITYPVVMDNDFAIWKSLGNRFWPTLYLIDKVGRIRKAQVGEIHEGSGAARQFEAMIRTILAEYP
jgi:alkyl hydroperoxide reductase subunit AhpC